MDVKLPSLQNGARRSIPKGSALLPTIGGCLTVHVRSEQLSGYITARPSREADRRLPYIGSMARVVRGASLSTLGDLALATSFRNVSTGDVKVNNVQPSWPLWGGPFQGVAGRSLAGQWHDKQQYCSDTDSACGP